MAFRWRRATGGWLLVAALVGVGCAQGSGSHALTGQAPAVEVLGAVEERASATPTSIAEAPTTAPAQPAGSAGEVDPPVRAPAEPPTTTTAGPAPSTSVTAPNPGLAVASAEPAPAPAEPIAEPEPDDLATATLARISYPWRQTLPGWDIAFLPGKAGLRGLTLPSSRRIEIYVRSSDTPATLARVVAHELGHAVDVTLNNAADRARWRAARGVDDTVPWWPEPSVTDFATLAGDFAEAFAVWQTGVTSQSTVAGQPTAAQLALLASLAG